MGQADSRQGLAGCLLLALPPQPRRDSQLAKIRLAFPGKPPRARKGGQARGSSEEGRTPACCQPVEAPVQQGSLQARQELPHVLRGVGDRLVTWKREGGWKHRGRDTQQRLTPACILPAPAYAASSCQASCSLFPRQHEPARAKPEQEHPMGDS